MINSYQADSLQAPLVPTYDYAIRNLNVMSWVGPLFGTENEARAWLEKEASNMHFFAIYRIQKVSQTVSTPKFTWKNV